MFFRFSNIVTETENKYLFTTNFEVSETFSPNSMGFCVGNIFVSVYAITTFFVILLSLYWLSVPKAKIIPFNMMQEVNELFITFIGRTVEGQVGAKGQRYFPFFYFYFIILLIANLLSLNPYSFSLTSHPSLGFYFGLNLLVIGLIAGFYAYGFSFLRTFDSPPDVPKLLGVFLSFIEVISFLMRIPSLVVRLTANMLAGHLLLEILAGFVYTMFLSGSNFLGSLLIIGICVIFVMKIFVSFLQAYIFVYLSTLYFKECLQGPFKH